MCRKTPQLLIIDDDINATKLIQHLLEKETTDLEVLTAHSVDEAEKAVSGSTALCGLLIDIHLQNGVDGLEYAQELRAKGQRCGITLMSGQVRHEGRFKFIEKPLDKHTLLKVVGSMISTWSIREDTKSMLINAGILKQALNGAGYVSSR